MKVPPESTRSAGRLERMTGTQVGPYRIIDQAGSGGMGVIWRAEDTRLGRQVALKFLPEAAQPGTQAFERLNLEARSASALNHPNICTLYDIGEHEGRPYLVLEFLEGMSLADRLKQQRPSIEEVVAWGSDLADALDAAHSKGILHRDIKPGNIFLTDRGQVKVLDFGLAKHSGPGLTLGEGADTATLTLDPHTSPGATLGTVTYMSPEQARGEDLDGRTDIFSLGIVLYEMASGKQPFAGNTAALVFDAILHRDPSPPSVYNREVPPELDRVIRKALEKDRQLRYQSAAEIRGDLLRLRRDSSSGKIPVAGEQRRSYLIPALIGVALVAATAAAMLFWSRQPHVESSSYKAAKITYLPSELSVNGVAISRDGTLVAYSDALGIHLKNLQSGEAQLLAGTEGKRVTYWHPDGTRILAREGGVANAWEISILGQINARAASPGRPSPDGKLYALVRENTEIWVEGPQREDPRLALSVRDPDFLPQNVHLFWSPNGKRLGYLRGSQRPDGAQVILESSDLDGGNPAPIAESVPGRPIIGAAWLEGGRLFYLVSDQTEDQIQVYETAVDVNTGERHLEPRQLVSLPGASSVGGLRASADGQRIVFTVGDSQSDVYLAQFDSGTGSYTSPKRLTLDDRQDVTPSWSPDGTTLYFASDRNGTMDIFRQGIDAPVAELLVGSADDENSPRVSSDGRWLYYFASPRTLRSRGPRSGKLMAYPLSGGASKELLVSDRLVRIACAQNTLCVAEVETGAPPPGPPPPGSPPPGGAPPPGAERVVYRLDPENGATELFRGPVRRWTATLSPDGKKFAHLSRIFRSPATLVVEDLTGKTISEREIEIPSGLGNGIAWTPDSTALLAGSGGTGGFGGAGGFGGFGGATASINRIGLDGRVAQVFSWPERRGPVTPALSPDGKTLAFTASTGEQNVWMLEAVK